MTTSTKRALLTILLSTFFTGCVKEAEQRLQEVLPQTDLREVVLHAGWAPETKTTLQEDGDIWWSTGDEISVFVGTDGEGGYKFTSIESGPSPEADFCGSILAADQGEYVAVYPFDESTSYDKDSRTVVLNLPEKQIARENNVPEKAFKSLAVSEDDNLFFKNLFSGIKFSVANDGIKEIEVATPQDVFLPSSNIGLSGITWISIEDDLAINSTSISRVTLVAPDNQCFTPGKYYYLVVPAAEYENGLIITYKKETSEATFVLDRELTFNRSIFKKLYDKDAGLDFHQRAQTHATILHFGHLLPNGVDKTTITEAHFHVLSEKTTDTMLELPDNTSEPIYFELDGTVANYYTSADVYRVGRARDLFGGWSSLKKLNLSSFDASRCTDVSGMFLNCRALQEIKFGEFNTSNATDMHSMFNGCISLESIDLSSFNTARVQDMSHMFLGCRALKELDLSNFDTHNVKSMGDMFEACYHLEKLDISGFSSDKLDYATALFNQCFSLLKLNMGSFDISNVNNFLTCHKLANRSRNCAILCIPATKEAMLSSEARLEDCESYIQWFVPGDVLPDLSMNFDPDMYYSTDYSQDKKVQMLNVASEGNGVDVVIMGEAYSDRLIANGTYEADMTLAMEQLFSIEPFKSFRHLFNVYMVYAVSENEVVGEFTAFQYYHDPWDGSGGVDRDDVALDEYISQAVGRSEVRDVATLIVVNDYASGGVAMVNGSLADSDNYDYPAKLAGIGFASKSTDSERFRYTICHEFGHAFAALHDEYVDHEGEMETWESDYKKYCQEHGGWWANVSFTPNPNLVGWHRFLEDGSGYDESEVSIIEGALYSQGIWKSVEESMMNAGGEFSVPAREAIYKKIHKVAYGEDWQYNFEDFVTWDKVAIASAPHTMSYSRSIKPSISRHQKPVFKIEKTISIDGTVRVTIIQN